jgi:hypothetical protein
MVNKKRSQNRETNNNFRIAFKVHFIYLAVSYFISLHNLIIIYFVEYVVGGP